MVTQPPGAGDAAEEARRRASTRLDGLERSFTAVGDRLVALEHRVATVAQDIAARAGADTEAMLKSVHEELRVTLGGAGEALREVVRVNLEDALAALRAETASANSRLTATSRDLEERFSTVRSEMEERLGALEGPVRDRVRELAEVLEQRTGELGASILGQVEGLRAEVAERDARLAGTAAQRAAADAGARKEIDAALHGLRTTIESNLGKLPAQVQSSFDALWKGVEGSFTQLHELSRAIAERTAALEVRVRETVAEEVDAKLSELPTRLAAVIDERTGGRLDDLAGSVREVAANTGTALDTFKHSVGAVSEELRAEVGSVTERIAELRAETATRDHQSRGGIETAITDRMDAVREAVEHVRTATDERIGAAAQGLRAAMDQRMELLGDEVRELEGRVRTLAQELESSAGEWVHTATEGPFRQTLEGMESLRQEVARLAGRLSEMTPPAPDLDALSGLVRAQVEEAMSAAAGHTSATLEQLRQSVEAELHRLHEQVRGSMSGLFRQIETIRGGRPSPSPTSPEADWTPAEPAVDAYEQRDQSSPGEPPPVAP